MIALLVASALAQEVAVTSDGQLLLLRDNRLVVSSDGGETWAPVPSLHYATAVFAQGDDWYVVSSGLSRSEDDGRTWQRVHEWTGEFHAYGATADALWRVGHDGFVVARSGDGGRTWEQVSAPQEFDADDVKGFGGASRWVVALPTVNPADYLQWGDPLEGDWTVPLSEDGGRSWRYYEGVEFGVDPGGRIVVKEVLHALFRSEDGGATWRTITPPGEGLWRGAAVHGAIVATVGQGDTLWISADGGATWREEPTVRPTGPLAALPDRVVATTENGLLIVPAAPGSKPRAPAKGPPPPAAPQSRYWPSFQAWIGVPSDWTVEQSDARGMALAKGDVVALLTQDTTRCEYYRAERRSNGAVETPIAGWPSIFSTPMWAPNQTPNLLTCVDLDAELGTLVIHLATPGDPPSAAELAPLLHAAYDAALQGEAPANASAGAPAAKTAPAAASAAPPPANVAAADPAPAKLEAADDDPATGAGPTRVGLLFLPESEALDTPFGAGVSLHSTSFGFGGERLGAGIGVDLGAAGGLLYDVRATFGPGAWIGRALGVGLYAGAGVDGITSRVPFALGFPVGARAAAPLGPVALEAWGETRWNVVGDPSRRDTEGLLGTDERGFGAVLHLGKRYAANDAESPLGLHVGVEQRGMMGATRTTIFVGTGGVSQPDL